jgi:hypothetical protein
VPNESYFLAFGGLGLTLAGFAGLIATLTPQNPSTSLVTSYRVRTIVFLGLSLTFVGFGTVAVYGVTAADVMTTARIGTLLMMIPFLRGLLVDSRPSLVWTDKRERRITVAIQLALMAAALANLVFASLAYLELLMLLGLIGPVTIFYNTIRDATRGEVAVIDTDAREAKTATRESG